MSYKNLVDMHVHTDNSFDGNDNVMAICEKACGLKARALAFTDHCEIDSKDCNLRKCTIPTYFEVMKARNAFTGELIVIEGIELGQAIYNKELAENILNSLQYDFVLGSIHNLKDMEDFFYLDYSKYDIDELLNKYFDTLFELTCWNKFDSLAHLTYPLRYIVGEQGIDVDLNKYKGKIEAIYDMLIKNEKALEINTSGLRQPYGQCLPNKELLQLYHDMGGQYITFGSDAHFVNDITKGIEQGYKMAYDCGFRQFTLFEHRMPLQIDIE